MKLSSYLDSYYILLVYIIILIYYYIFDIIFVLEICVSTSLFVYRTKCHDHACVACGIQLQHSEGDIGSLPSLARTGHQSGAGASSRQCTIVTTVKGI